VAPSLFYFTALTEFTYLLTYFTKEATQTIHRFNYNYNYNGDLMCAPYNQTDGALQCHCNLLQNFVQNCGRYIENYCSKHKNLVGCMGASPQTPIIRSRSRDRNGCVFDLTFLYPPRPLNVVRMTDVRRARSLNAPYTRGGAQQYAD